MAGQIASFFASLGFKADYKELDKFEKRLKQLQGSEVKSAVRAERQKTAAVAREHKVRGKMLQKVNQQYRRQEVKDMAKLRADRQALAAEKTNAINKVNGQKGLTGDQRASRVIAIQQQYDEAFKRIDREEQALHDKEIARRKKLAELKKRQADEEQRRIQARGRLEAQAYAENESRARRAHKAELRRIRELEVARRRLRHQVKRKVGYGVGAAAAMGFGGAMSVQSYQQSLGMERGLTAGTGSKDLGQKEMDWLVQTANKLGVFVGDIGTGYAQIVASTKGTSVEGQGARDVFESILSQARVLNLSAMDTQGSMRAVSQIFSKNQIMAEEARSQLGERMPGVIQNLAKAAQDAGLSKTGSTKELDKLMTAGALSPELIMPFFAKRMMESAKAGGALEESMNSTAASIGRFRTAVWDANRTFNQSGFDKMVGELFDTMAFSIDQANPVWQLFGKISEDVGRALETPIELFGTLSEMMDGVFIDKAGEYTGFAKRFAAALLLVSKRARIIALAFWLLPATLSAINDTLENGMGGWDDWVAKLGIAALAVAFLAGPLTKLLKLLRSISGAARGAGAALKDSFGGGSGAKGGAKAGKGGLMGKLSSAGKGLGEGARRLILPLLAADTISDAIKPSLGLDGPTANERWAEKLRPTLRSGAMTVGEQAAASQAIMNGDVVFNISGDPSLIEPEVTKTINKMFNMTSNANPPVEKQ